MSIRNGILRAAAAIGVALFSAVVVFGLLIRIPMWLFGRAEPWELRSINDHLSADEWAIGFIFLLLATVPALAAILYRTWCQFDGLAEGDRETTTSRNV